MGSGKGEYVHIEGLPEEIKKKWKGLAGLMNMTQKDYFIYLVKKLYKEKFGEEKYY